MIRKRTGKKLPRGKSFVEEPTGSAPGVNLDGTAHPGDGPRDGVKK